MAEVQIFLFCDTQIVKEDFVEADVCLFLGWTSC